MNRFRLAFGILMLSAGVTDAIVNGISKPEGWEVLLGFFLMLLGSGNIAYAFPKKAP